MSHVCAMSGGALGGLSGKGGPHVGRDGIAGERADAARPSALGIGYTRAEAMLSFGGEGAPERVGVKLARACGPSTPQWRKSAGVLLFGGWRGAG